MIVTVRCGTWVHVGSRSPVVECVKHALLMRYSHTVMAVALENHELMGCAFFSRQSRYSNATHAPPNARQSFLIMSPSIASVFNDFYYFSVRYAIVDGDRQGVTGLKGLRWADFFVRYAIVEADRQGVTPWRSASTIEILTSKVDACTQRVKQLQLSNQETFSQRWFNVRLSSRSNALCVVSY